MPLAANVDQAELDQISCLLEVGRNILRKKLKRAQKRRFSDRREQLLRELEDDGRIPELAAAIKADQYRFHRFRKGYEPKPGGGTRTISRQMDHWDRVIDLGLGLLLAAVIEPLLLPCCIGYRRGTSATPFLLDLQDRIRRGQRYPSLDIKGFFPSVYAQRLKCTIGRLDLPGCLRKLLDRLVFGRQYLKGEEIVGLPQGLAVSPTLSNLYLAPLDRKITKGLDPQVIYRRLSDNLIFAGPEGSLDGVEDLVNRSLPTGMVLKITHRDAVLGYNVADFGLTVPTKKITSIWKVILKHLNQSDTKAARAAWCGWHNNHAIADRCPKRGIARKGYLHIRRYGSYPDDQLDALKSLPTLDALVSQPLRSP
jgi:hypothetical protein